MLSGEIEQRSVANIKEKKIVMKDLVPSLVFVQNIALSASDPRSA